MNQLTARDGLAEVSARHARWCQDVVARVGSQLAGAGEIEGVARLAELWPNLRAAVDWACQAQDPLLADALVRPIVCELSLRRQADIGRWAERILELTAPHDDDRIAFWLLWAGHRYAQSGDQAAYDALVRGPGHGHEDHPMIRFTTSFLSEVGEDLHAAGRAAVAWLREHGEDHAANLVEFSGVASSLMALQQFAGLDELATTLAERYLAQGPPTLRYFALGFQGYAAQYQGRHEEAGQYFRQAEALDLPAGTYRVIQTATARMAFERGDRADAYATLRDNIESPPGCRPRRCHAHGCCRVHLDDGSHRPSRRRGCGVDLPRHDWRLRGLGATPACG